MLSVRMRCWWRTAGPQAGPGSLPTGRKGCFGDSELDFVGETYVWWFSGLVCWEGWNCDCLPGSYHAFEQTWRSIRCGHDDLHRAACRNKCVSVVDAIGLRSVMLGFYDGLDR